MGGAPDREAMREKPIRVLLVDDQILSGREVEVARLVGAGATNREIAHCLTSPRVRQKPHLQDPQEAGSQGPHTTGAIRHQALAGRSALRRDRRREDTNLAGPIRSKAGSSW